MASSTSSTATPSPKQLVFLFMASTVVAVVVFLCGVLVGRGVPVRQVAGVSPSGVGNEAFFGPGRAGELTPAVLDPVSNAPSAAASAGDDLTYFQRLEEDGPFDESLTAVDGAPLAAAVSTGQPAAGASPRQQASPPAVEPRPEPPPVPERGSGEEPVAPVPAAGEDLRRASNEPDAPLPQLPNESPPTTTSGYAYTVQVAALREHDAAEQVAGRLIAKGFPAYVLEPSPDVPVAVYRVRVGQYRDLGEAEQIRQRLETEERFKPWITR